MMWTLKVSTERQGKRLNSNNKNPETENSQNENIEVEEKVVKRPGRPRRKTTNDKPAAVKRTQTRGAKKKEDAPLGKGLKIIPLGGLEQIGMNITAFEYDDSIVVVDCGLSFPEDEMLGIDPVSYTHLVWSCRNKSGRGCRGQKLGQCDKGGRRLRRETVR